jgi:site-specific recombinase
MSGSWDLTALVNAADPKAGLAERHLWLVRLTEWLRHAPTVALLRSDEATPLPALRLRQLLRQLDQHPEPAARVRGLADAFWRDIDTPSLFADFGLGARLSFGSELLARVQARLLPGTPETRDLGTLFKLLFEGADAAWIAALDDDTVQRALHWLGPDAGQLRAGLLDALQILASQVQAAGHAPALRQRMDRALLVDEPFRQVGATVTALRQAAAGTPADDELLHREAGYLRALLDHCRRASASVMPQLESQGVSVNIVYDLDQLDARCQRIEALLDALLAPEPRAEGRRLLGDLVTQLTPLKSVRALFARHYSLLARQVAERSAETGEHYIARDRAEYQQMLQRAYGGGALIAATTFVKFAIGALGLSAFWTGWWSGVNYALSFVIVMLLHWTVATKQPAMTAPALAATLPNQRSGRESTAEEIEGFVDRVAQLIRTQVAAIVGNLAACFPIVLAVQLAALALFGAPPVNADEARYVLASQTLLGPTLLFAAFTGVLLFASSLIAGWTENWFVYHRLDSAIAWNPRVVARLGAARAQRWAHWWRRHISGLAANVSLGFMLGLVPAVAGFFALPLEVRHVTLSAGQLAAALGALGWDVLREPAFWWCVAAIPLIGALNVGVSFLLAFRVALRSRGVRVGDRSRIYAAIRLRLRERPMSFLRPPRFG